MNIAIETVPSYDAIPADFVGVSSHRSEASARKAAEKVGASRIVFVVACARFSASWIVGGTYTGKKG